MLLSRREAKSKNCDARAFWANDVRFSVAAVLPRYLEADAREFMAEFGCENFFVLGYVNGAPNVTLIFDPTEVDDQEYDSLLRNAKKVEINDKLDGNQIGPFTDLLIFPGSFDLSEIVKRTDCQARLHIDVAYDVASIDVLAQLNRRVATIFLSTSSQLFMGIVPNNIDDLVKYFGRLNISALILKENRGGSRLRTFRPDQTFYIPAQLSTTVNSVGVGDVYAATYLSHLSNGPSEAAWRASYASAAYSETTFPSAFQTMVSRNMALTVQDLMELGGTVLPWHERHCYPIYLAAPDFKRANRSATDRSLSSLGYHNFRVRRPVQENGELPPNSEMSALLRTYRQDVQLLDQCALVFGIGTDKDPGTLVEIGLAIAKKIPVVVFDPNRDCSNTMVIAGSNCYSEDLDTCLNAVFNLLSEVRAKSAATSSFSLPVD